VETPPCSSTRTAVDDEPAPAFTLLPCQFSMCTIAETLLHALQAEGVSEIFGVPGDYTLGFNVAIENMSQASKSCASHVSFVNMCTEESAGFAADAYARLKGMGCCLATFNVGGLKLLNAAASCAAERVPVVFLVGMPGTSERSDDSWKHHGWGHESYDVPRKTFAAMTCATATLDDPFTAASEIARVLQAAKQQQRPVYIELPRDCLNKPLSHSVTAPVLARTAAPALQLQHTFNSWAQRTQQVQVDAAVTALMPLLNTSKSVALVVGVETQRFKLQESVLLLADIIKSNQLARARVHKRTGDDCKDPDEESRGQTRGGVVLATTVLGKSALEEPLPGAARGHCSVGTYLGLVGNPLARSSVEEAGVVLLLGVLPSDTNFRLLGSRLLDPEDEGDSRAAGRTVVRMYDNAFHLKSQGQTLTLRDVPLKALLTGLVTAMHTVQELGFFTFSDSAPAVKTSASMYAPARAPTLALAVNSTVESHQPPSMPLAQFPPIPIRVDAMFDIVRTLLIDTSLSLAATSSTAAASLASTQPLLLIADTGDAIFGSLGLPILPGMRDNYIASVFYLTMGWAIPAAVGAFYAKPDRRPLVFEGDGSFQMSGNEVSTLLRCGSNAIIVLMNNSGYTTQRAVADGGWSDLSAWDYTKVVQAYDTAARDATGASSRLYVAKIHTQSEFTAALHLALSPEFQRKLVLLEVVLSSLDRSAALVAITTIMRADVKAAACTAAAGATTLCTQK